MHKQSSHQQIVTRCAPKEDISPEWLTSPEAKRALRIAGWPDCSPAEFFEALIVVLDAIEAGASVIDQELKARGLTYAEFTAMAADVSLLDCSIHDRMSTRAAAARKAVRRLFLADFGADHIAALLDLDPTEVEEYLRSSGMNAAGRQIVKLHREGRTPTQIAKELRIGRTTAEDAIRAIGEKPNRERTFLASTKRAAIARMYRDGATYTQIMSQLGVNKSQVTNTLRSYRTRGLLPEYGARREAS